MIHKIIFGSIQYLFINWWTWKKKELKVKAGFAIIFPSSIGCIRSVSSDLLLGRSALIISEKHQAVVWRCSMKPHWTHLTYSWRRAPCETIQGKKTEESHSVLVGLERRLKHSRNVGYSPQLQAYLWQRKLPDCDWPRKKLYLAQLITSALVSSLLYHK